MVLRSEHLFRQPQEIWEQVLAFLELDLHPLPNSISRYTGGGEGAKVGPELGSCYFMIDSPSVGLGNDEFAIYPWQFPDSYRSGPRAGSYLDRHTADRTVFSTESDNPQGLDLLVLSSCSLCRIGSLRKGC